MDAFDMECEDVPGDPGPEGATVNTGGDVDEAMQTMENTAAAAGSIQMPGVNTATCEPSIEDHFQRSLTSKPEAVSPLTPILTVSDKPPVTHLDNTVTGDAALQISGVCSLASQGLVAVPKPVQVAPNQTFLITVMNPGTTNIAQLPIQLQQNNPLTLVNLQNPQTPIAIGNIKSTVPTKVQTGVLPQLLNRPVLSSLQTNLNDQTYKFSNIQSELSKNLSVPINVPLSQPTLVQNIQSVPSSDQNAQQVHLINGQNSNDISTEIGNVDLDATSRMETDSSQNEILPEELEQRGDEDEMSSDVVITPKTEIIVKEEPTSPDGGHFDTEFPDLQDSIPEFNTEYSDPPKLKQEITAAVPENIHMEPNIDHDSSSETISVKSTTDCEASLTTFLNVTKSLSRPKRQHHLISPTKLDATLAQVMRIETAKPDAPTNVQMALLSYGLQSLDNDAINPKGSLSIAGLALRGEENSLVKRFWCNFCEFSTFQAREFLQHSSAHIFNCKQCEFKAYTRSEILLHTKCSHGGLSNEMSGFEICKIGELSKKDSLTRNPKTAVRDPRSDDQKIPSSEVTEETAESQENGSDELMSGATKTECVDKSDWPLVSERMFTDDIEGQQQVSYWWQCRRCNLTFDSSITFDSHRRDEQSCCAQPEGRLSVGPLSKKTHLSENSKKINVKVKVAPSSPDIKKEECLGNKSKYDISIALMKLKEAEEKSTIAELIGDKKFDPQVCPYCKSLFTTRNNLKTHLVEQHPDLDHPNLDEKKEEVEQKTTAATPVEENTLQLGSIEENVKKVTQVKYEKDSMLDPLVSRFIEIHGTTHGITSENELQPCVKTRKILAAFKQPKPQIAKRIARPFQRNPVSKYPKLFKCKYCLLVFSELEKFKQHCMDMHKEMDIVCIDLRAFKLRKAMMVYMCRSCQYHTCKNAEYMTHVCDENKQVLARVVPPIEIREKPRVSPTHASPPQIQARTNKLKSKKRVYTTDFKIKIVASSLDIGKMPTARLFGINEKLIRDWSKRKDIVHAATKMNNAPKKSPINLTPQKKNHLAIRKPPTNIYEVKSMPIKLQQILKDHQLVEGDTVDMNNVNMLLVCNHCSHVSLSVPALKKHLVQEHPYKPLIAWDFKAKLQRQTNSIYYCPDPKCKFVTYYLEAIHKHRSDQIQCPLLDVQEDEQWGLRRYRQFVPPNLKALTENSTRMQRPMASKFDGVQKRYRCRYCKYGSGILIATRDHTMLHHPGKELSIKDLKKNLMKQKCLIACCDRPGCNFYCYAPDEQHMKPHECPTTYYDGMSFPSDYAHQSEARPAENAVSYPPADVVMETDIDGDNIRPLGSTLLNGDLAVNQTLNAINAVPQPTHMVANKAAAAAMNGKDFDDEDDYDDDDDDDDDDVETYRCSNCSFSSISLSDMREHLLYQHAGPIASSLKTESSTQQTTITTANTSPPAQPAPSPAKTDTTESSPGGASVTGSGEKMYKCSYCPFMTTVSTVIKKHMVAEHQQDGQYSVVSTALAQDGNMLVNVSNEEAPSAPVPAVLQPVISPTHAASLTAAVRVKKEPAVS